MTAEETKEAEVMIEAEDPVRLTADTERKQAETIHLRIPVIIYFNTKIQ